MNFLEGPTACDLREYQSGEDSRLKARELQVDELYVVMFALEPVGEKGIRAARIPAKLEHIRKRNRKLYDIELTFLNANLQPSMETGGVVNADGFWVDARDQVIIGSSGYNGVDRAYFRGVDEDVDDDLRQLTDELSFSH